MMMLSSSSLLVALRRRSISFTHHPCRSYFSTKDHQSNNNNNTVMIFASEVSVIAALNRYYSIEDVFDNVYRRSAPKVVRDTVLSKTDATLSAPTPNETIALLESVTGSSNATTTILEKVQDTANVAVTPSELQRLASSVIPTLLPSDVEPLVKKKITTSLTNEMKKTYMKPRAALSDSDKLERLIVDTKNKDMVSKLVSKASEVKASAASVTELTKEVESSLQNLPKDREEKSKLVSNVVSEIQKSYGTSQEPLAIAEHERKSGTLVTDRNTKFYYRSLGRINDDFEVLIGGKVDGVDEKTGRVVEVKNRLRRFMNNPIPSYDMAQLQSYLFILDKEEAELIERLKKNSGNNTHSTIVARDRKYWDEKIMPFITPFAHSMVSFINDMALQQEFIIHPENRRDIIRSLWVNAPDIIE